MLNNVKKNILTTFPFFKYETKFGHAQEIFDTIQTMNISQTLNFSILLILMELVNLISYLAMDINGRLISPISFAILLFLAFMTSNIFFCEHVFRLERNQRTRRLMKHHTYIFTGVFSVFCLSINYFCLQSRMSAESVLMFYIYIAAGPIFTFRETLAAILVTAALALPSFIMRDAPVSVYSNLFLYSFTSLFLSQVRCRIIGNHLRLLREARDEQVYLQSQADNDPLTHILNRNGFSQRLEGLLTSAVLLQVPVAVIMVDIDYFKQYNDTFGHMAGDECLKKIAAALAARIHQGKDLICRFGGEEFQIFLYGIKPYDAIQAAERLRQSIAGLEIPSANQTSSPYVTISVGVSSAVPQSLDYYSKMVKAADDELYYAKSHGKNMVSSRELPPAKEAEPDSPSVTQCASFSYQLPRF